jgi:hypothetical protein
MTGLALWYAHLLVDRGCDQVRHVRVPACRLSLDARQTMGPAAIALRALSASPFHEVVMLHVIHHRDSLSTHRLARKHTRTHLGLALDTLQAAQRRLVALLLFSRWLTSSHAAVRAHGGLRVVIHDDAVSADARVVLGDAASQACALTMRPTVAREGAVQGNGNRRE